MGFKISHYYATNDPPTWKQCNPTELENDTIPSTPENAFTFAEFIKIILLFHSRSIRGCYGKHAHFVRFCPLETLKILYQRKEKFFNKAKFKLFYLKKKVR